MIFVRDHDDALLHLITTYIAVNIKEDLYFSTWVLRITKLLCFDVEFAQIFFEKN